MSTQEIVPPVWRAFCDHAGCEAYIQEQSDWLVRRLAWQAGWQLRPNRGKGSRTAPDFCPEHRGGTSS